MDLRELSIATDNVHDETKKKKLPPLLRRLTEVIPPKLNYLGVSFGLTKEIFHFWQKNQFEPAYLSLKKNDITAEYTVIVLKPLV